MRTLSKITLLVFLLPCFIYATELNGKYTKSKTIKKEFNVNSNALVDLDNKYGSIDITTWNENRVTLEIIITTSSNKESKAINRLEEITVEISNSSSIVSAKTKIGKSNNWGSNSNASMDIQYIIKMPANNNLTIDMDYGDVMINKLNGKANINIDYGKLLAGQLNGNSNEINLDYSRGSAIDKIGNATINIDYSSLDIEEAGDIDLNTDYSDTSIKKVKNLDFNTDYGSVTIGDAISINGNADYANLKVGTIENSLIINADYGNLKVEKMGVHFSKIEIDTDYIGVKIGVDSNSSFNYTINTKYGGITLPSGVNNSREIDKNNSKTYEGTYNGTGGKVSITTTYGSVKIMTN